MISSPGAIKTQPQKQTSIFSPRTQSCIHQIYYFGPTSQMYNKFFGLSEKDRHNNLSINILDASSILWFQLFPRGTDVVCCFPENSYVTVFGSCLNITCYSRIYQKGGLNQWLSVLFDLYEFVFRMIHLQNILLSDKLKSYTKQYIWLIVFLSMKQEIKYRPQ